jgi:hypothetical protein
MNNDELLSALNEIKTLTEKCIKALSGNSKTASKPVAKQKVLEDAGSSPILAIVNKIKDCEEADKIGTRILDKSAVAGRILLPFYFCYTHFPEQRLTTGDVEKITNELGVKVKTSNVSSAIANSLHKYLEGSSTRKQGKAVSYKLNRKGAKYFESLLVTDEE